MIPGNVYVSGITAMTDDLNAQLRDTLPLFIGAVIAVSFLLLMLVFRSVVVPLKAAVMNLLSIGAAYGVLVAVFQWGWGSSLIGLEGPTPITSLIIVIMFPILFGLSMDYEVFLLSRIREEYVRTGDNTESVARGLAGTGRVITSAALIMIAVFLSFVASPVPSLKMLGLGLATAILDRRHPRPHGAGAGDDGPAGQGQLVAARLAGPDPAPPDRRGLGRRREARRPTRRRRRVGGRPGGRGARRSLTSGRPVRWPRHRAGGQRARHVRAAHSRSRIANRNSLPHAP